MNVNHSKSKSLESASIVCLAVGIFGCLAGVCVAIASASDYDSPVLGIAIAVGSIYLLLMGLVMSAIVPITKNAEKSLAESGDKDYIAKEPEKK